jgi:putative tricarboxylic transport membrane protein
MGLFGLSEVLLASEKPVPKVSGVSMKSLYPSKADLKDSAMPIARGTVLGFFLGLIPGTTQALASFLSYAVEKGVSRHPERFGKGAIEGVAGPETANNSHANAALIPLFTLGIPGSPSIAILLGAFIMNGLTPGPLLFSQHPEVVWPIIASMIVGNLMLLLLNVPLVGMWVKVLQIPPKILNPLIIMFICLGTFLVNNNPFDVWVMLLFGLIGVVLRKLQFPMAPLALTMIVGPLMEGALRQALSISRGGLEILVRGPLSISLLAVAAIIITLPLWSSRVRRKRGVLGTDAVD